MTVQKEFSLEVSNSFDCPTPILDHGCYNRRQTERLFEVSDKNKQVWQKVAS